MVSSWLAVFCGTIQGIKLSIALFKLSRSEVEVVGEKGEIHEIRSTDYAQRIHS